MTSTAHLHQTTSSTCPMPNFAVLEARKLGISWKYKIKCANCQFTFPTFNMYHEIHQEGPGHNPSATNITLAYAIQDTAIRAEKMIELSGHTCSQQIIHGDTPVQNKQKNDRTEQIGHE
uniref:Mutator-like transposase domain-containing protein n=1 Tax=Magallana gigas TaxID=29159 RepID=K1R196_MAGGI